MAASAERILNILCDHLSEGIQEGYISLVNYGSGQARRESTENEEIIGRALRSFTAGHLEFSGDLSFSVATNGSWYDFLVQSSDGTVFLPINLKVSTLRGRDNVSSKKGLFYALTGEPPEDSLINNWEDFCQNLALHLRHDECDADYYFLVVEKSKKGVGRVFWTSLLRLESVWPNGSNPPFQACWRENLEHSERSRSQAIDYLLDTVGQTFVLRARALESFRNHLVPRLSGTFQNRWDEGQTPEVEGEAD